MQVAALAARQEVAEQTITDWFSMLYLHCLKNTELFSLEAAIHAKQRTVMPKDSRVVKQMLTIWEPKSFLSYPTRIHANSSEAQAQGQQLPPSKPSKRHHTTVAKHLTGHSTTKGRTPGAIHG